MNRFIQHSRDALKLLLALIITPIYKVFNKDKIYLIGERRNQCQDNGYHFFKYVRNEYKEEKVYYCIQKESEQIDKVKSLGNIVYDKSFKHYLYYVIAEKLICSHIGSCTPDTPFVWMAESKGIIKKNKVFIQHGITKELIPSLMYKNSNMNIFICGAKPEYEFVKNQFDYPEGNVKQLGFCRFDNLFNCETKQQILLMPTWRAWLGGSTWGGDDNEFLSSSYYINLKSILNSNYINNYLVNNNISLIFYPHHEIQKYIKYFTTNTSNIIIADSEIYDVQELLKESKVLITDYSSVAFDFAYMKKSIIYYQFDSEEYNKKHYAKGYFEYERDGFGDVAINIEQLLEAIERIGENELKYKERADKFFSIHDNKNCERHYQYIIKNIEG